MSLNFNWVTPMSAGHSKVMENVVYAKKCKAGRKSDDGTQTYQLGLTIPEKAMKEARFVVGDRVEAGFAKDENGLWVVAVRRVLSGGYGISSASGVDSKSAKGKSIRGKIQMTFRDGMPELFYSKSDGYEIDTNGMLVAWEEK